MSDNKIFRIGCGIFLTGILAMDMGGDIVEDVGAILCFFGIFLASVSGGIAIITKHQKQFTLGIMPTEQSNSQTAEDNRVIQSNTSQTYISQPTEVYESRNDEQPQKLDLSSPSKDDQEEKKANFWDNI